ncbi:MAG: esterase family protein [Lachnospiraceae bacterium]|nr:esterase family protein [Lachnospiraceae bacterium]
MTLAELKFRSDCLSRNTRVNVLLPKRPAGECPVLMLLHGMHGTYDDWLRRSTIEVYAQEHGIAVVMPDGENSFYHDMKYGEPFFTYVAEELPEVMQRTFGLSAERDKNLIAGLSMGGYGAFRFALLRPDRYYAAISLSGCLDITSRVAASERAGLWTRIWGEDYQETAPKSDSDVIHLIRSFPFGKQAPKMYLACGTEDFLYQDHKTAIEALESRKDVFTYVAEEGPGEHNWPFWETWIKRALDQVL